jgi:hypothetical protein
MKTLLVLLSAFGVGLSMAVAQTPGGSSYSSLSSYSDSRMCKAVELKPGESLPLATPVAGLPKPPGRKTAEAARTIPIPDLADGSRVVIHPDGSCTIYRHKAHR